MPFTGTPWKLRGNRSIYMIIFLTLGLSIFLVVCPFFVRPPVFPIFTFIPEGRAEGRRSLQIWKLYSIDFLHHTCLVGVPMTSYHFVIRSHGSLNMTPSFVLEYFCPSTRQSGYLASPFVLCTWYISGNCAAFLIRQPRFRVYNNKHIGMYHTCSSCLFWRSEKDEWALTVPDFLCSRLRSSQRKRKIGALF